MARLLPLLSSIVIFFRPSLGAATVSISSVVPSDGHQCIDNCLLDGVFSNLGDAMGCDSPYENACYCATEAGSMSVADNFLSRCGSSSCGRGDFTRDVNSMQSLYASYCMGAGFTQAGATKWYNPATATEETSSSTSASDESSSATSDAEPSKTADSGVAETTTHFTIVTQTTEGGSAATKSRVVIQVTSTLWVNSDGSPVTLNDDDSNDSSSVKIGVGVAIPVAAILAAALGWWFWRRRRRSKPSTQSSLETGANSVSTAPPPMSAAPVTRKPVGSSVVSPVSAATVAAVSPESKTNELSNETELKREIDGHEIQPFPNVTPNPPIEVTGRHEITGDTALRPEMDGQSPRAEVSGDGRLPELSGQAQSPPPGYTQTFGQPVQRWELPDNSR